MKKIIIVLFMTLCMCACTVTTSSSASFSTSVTADGKTTTTETKIENGVSTSTTTEMSEDDPTGLRKEWAELFDTGAEGMSDMGCEIYFAYNSDEESSLAAVMIVNGETGELLLYEFGEIEDEDDHMIIYDIEGDSSLPYSIGEEQYDDGFDIYFQDGDHAFLQFVSAEQIIDDMISIWEVQCSTYVDPKKEQ